MDLCTFKKYTKEEFIDAVKTSTSFRQVLHKLNIKKAGGNYKTAKRKIKLLNLDISHFTGQAYLKGKTHNWWKKIPLQEILIKDSTYSGSYKLKNRLLKEGLFERKCYKCEMTKWLNQLIPLELDHINGENFDNRIENLTLLCPNCHALTPTYRGKNKNKKNG